MRSKFLVILAAIVIVAAVGGNAFTCDMRRASWFFPSEISLERDASHKPMRLSRRLAD